jgi:raffinose/stachyose/melibiose transport system substrate-binding protein
MFVLVAALVAGASSAQDNTVAIWAADNDTGACWSSLLVETFPREDVNVEVVLQPGGNLVNTQRTALQGGAGPDITYSHGPAFMLELASAGLLLSLDHYADEYNWADRFAPWALDLGRVEGSLYSLSEELETVIMYYNKTVFEEHGWQIPKTMEELYALADAIRDAGLVVMGPAFGECAPCVEWAVSVFLSHHAGPDKVYEALTGQRLWTDPVFVEAITELKRIVQDGWYMGSLDLFFSDTFDSAHALFGAGEIAMSFEGTWMLDNYQRDFFGEAAGNMNEWDWFSFPTTFTEEQFFIIGVGSSWGISSGTQNPDASAAVLDHYYSTSFQAQMFESCGRAPAPLIYDGDVFKNADPREARLYEQFGLASAAGNVGYTSWSFWPARTNVWLWEQIVRVYDDQISVEDYLAGMQSEFDEEFAEGLIPPIPAR